MMSISLVTRDRGVLSKTVSLPKSLARAVSFSSNLYVRLRSVDIVADLKVAVALISEMPEPDRGRWITVPLLEEVLDLSFFVTVIFETDRVSSGLSAVSIDDQINNLVLQEPKSQQDMINYSMGIPQQLRDVSDLMHCMLAKCTHRCENFLKQIQGA